MKLKVDEDYNAQKLLHDKHIELAKIFLEGCQLFTLWVMLINYLL